MEEPIATIDSNDAKLLVASIFKCAVIDILIRPRANPKKRPDNIEIVKVSFIPNSVNLDKIAANYDHAYVYSLGYTARDDSIRRLYYYDRVKPMIAKLKMKKQDFELLDKYVECYANVPKVLNDNELDLIEILTSHAISYYKVNSKQYNSADAKRFIDKNNPQFQKWCTSIDLDPAAVERNIIRYIRRQLRLNR